MPAVGDAGIATHRRFGVLGSMAIVEKGGPKPCPGCTCQAGSGERQDAPLDRTLWLELRRYLKAAQKELPASSAVARAGQNLIRSIERATNQDY